MGQKNESGFYLYVARARDAVLHYNEQESKTQNAADLRSKPYLLVLFDLICFAEGHFLDVCIVLISSGAILWMGRL